MSVPESLSCVTGTGHREPAWRGRPMTGCGAYPQPPVTGCDAGGSEPIGWRRIDAGVATSGRRS
jgi:hypothetical protein